jgi:hypothetical protein
MPNLGVLNHPQRDRILDMIVKGTVSDSEIARSVKPPLHRATIMRWRHSVAQQAVAPVQAMTKALQDQGLLPKEGSDIKIRNAETGVAKLLASASPLIARLDNRRAIFDAAIPQALESKDFRGLSSLLNTECKSIETIARISGVIDSPGAHAGNTIVFILPESQQQQTPQHLVDDVDIIDVEPASD